MRIAHQSPRRPMPKRAQDEAKAAQADADKAAKQADYAKEVAKDKLRIAQLEKEVATLLAERDAANKAKATLQTDIKNLRSHVAQLETDLSQERARANELEEALAQTLVDEEWQDPAQFVLQYKPELSHSEACAWVRDRLAELNSTWETYEQYPGWGKKSASKYSKWVAQEQALQRDLLPALLDDVWQDPAEFVLQYRPEFSKTEASKWVRDRLAVLGITWDNYQDRPGWAKASGSKYSKWVAQGRALRRDLLPALSQ